MFFDGGQGNSQAGLGLTQLSELKVSNVRLVEAHLQHDLEVGVALDSREKLLPTDHSEIDLVHVVHVVHLVVLVVHLAMLVVRLALLARLALLPCLSRASKLKAVVELLQSKAELKASCSLNCSSETSRPQPPSLPLPSPQPASSGDDGAVNAGGQDPEGVAPPPPPSSPVPLLPFLPPSLPHLPILLSSLSIPPCLVTPSLVPLLCF